VKLPSDCWDLSRALDGVGGDQEFLSELAGIFCAAYPTLQNDLEQSIAAKNYFRVADAAHMLARAARNIAATRVMEAAVAIEMMARRKEFDDIDNALYAVRQEGSQLLDALSHFRNGRSGSSGL
jgi:HPt (histidine-containing phosphotransfer) domain-containing protein